MTRLPDPRVLRGSCLCGDVRFELRGPVTFIKHCHCSQCRKMSGGAVFTYARARTSDFRPLQGFESLQLYERRPGNLIAFCRRCGSLVPYPPPGSSELEFGAGLLDDDPSVRPSYHIFVASSAPWEQPPSDDLPQWQEQVNGARVPLPPALAPGWRSLLALAERFESASAAYARALGFSRDDDWFLLKLQEELGELSQAWVRLTGRGRTLGIPREEQLDQLADEAADLFGHVLLFVRRHGLALGAAITRKWRFTLED